MEGGAEEAEGQLPEAQAWDVGTQDLPKTLQRRGGLALTCRGGAARAHAEPAGAVAGAPRPAAATVAGRARAAARLGLGSGSASRAAAAAGGGRRRPGCARAVWRRQVLRLQLRGHQLPAPRPPPRGRSPARRPCGLGRSWPAAVGGPAPTRALPPLVFPSSPLAGTLRPGGERDTPRSPRPAARAGIQNDPFLISVFPALLPRGRRPWRTQRTFILPYIFPTLIPSLSC